MKTVFIVILIGSTFCQSLAADVIQCVQGEPLVTESFDTEKGTVTVITPDNFTNPRIETQIRFEIKGPGEFEFLRADGTLRRRLLLNFKGSDGKADFFYPYDGGTNGDGSRIGCESKHLKVKR